MLRILSWDTLKGLLLLSTLMFVSIGISGQPNSIIADTTLYKHGRNASGASAYENTDSVSIGGTTTYFYMPDTGTNPGFDKTYLNLWAGVTDTFTWTVTPALAPLGAVSVATHPTANHYRQINWSGVIGTGTIEVKIKTPANCENTNTTPVEVIPLPTVQFSSTGSSICLPSGSDGSLGYTLSNIPVSWTSKVNHIKNLRVNISIVCTNSAGSINYSDIVINGVNNAAQSGAATFNLPANLNYYGLYTITLTAINDRISTKSKVNGTVVAGFSTYRFLLSKVPSSSPLYHVPNDENY